MTPSPNPTAEDADNTLDLALNKAALQSSLSGWSVGGSLEEDAARANNGRTEGPYGCHTDGQASPWWQVDLESATTINRVEVVNRADHAERLSHFSLLTSLDAENWRRVFCKSDDDVFGHDGTPLVVTLAPPPTGRFLRLQLDANDVLHFHQLRVFGAAASPGARAAAEAEAVAQSNARAAFTAGREGEVLSVGGFQVFVDTQRYSPPILGALRRGDYEGRERQVLRGLLREEDRVLEAGTAIGVISMTAAAVVGAANVRTFDANARITDDARRNFVFNDLAAIQAQTAVLKSRRRWNGPDERLAFGVSRDFWSSRLGVGFETEDIVEVDEVPTRCLEDEIAAHRANVLICDIEGGEVDLLMDADLSGLELILLETHYWATGEPAADALIRKLVNEGLSPHLGLSGAHVTVLRRTGRVCSA